MAKYSFTYWGTLNNLNDYLRAERIRFSSYGGRCETKGNIMKKDAQKNLIPCILKDLRGVNVHPPVRLNYHFYEPNKKRDLDNVAAFAMKVIQDSLVKANVLENDGWQHIRGFTCQFDVDKAHPRIVVEIEEM